MALCVQYLANEFCIKWKSFQTRQKWTRAHRNVKVDVVIVKDEGLPWNQWHLAPVVETYLSDDALVRNVKLLVADSSLDRCGKRSKPPVYLNRPVQKLVLLVQSNEP